MPHTPVPEDVKVDMFTMVVLRRRLEAIIREMVIPSDLEEALSKLLSLVGLCSSYHAHQRSHTTNNLLSLMKSESV